MNKAPFRFLSTFAPLLAVCLIAMPAWAGIEEIKITVDAGKHDRINVPVAATIQMQAGAQPPDVDLVDPDGNRLAGQWTPPWLLSKEAAAAKSQPADAKDGAAKEKAAKGDEATKDATSPIELNFIVPKLAAGQKVTYQLAVAEKSEQPRFSWHDTEGEHLDLKLGDQLLLQYVYKAPNPRRIKLTGKVFHHIFDPSGQRLTHNGEGKYSHQLGLFYAFSKIHYKGIFRADVWNCKGDSHQSHNEEIFRVYGPVLGRHRVDVNWHGLMKRVFANEVREVTAYNVPDGVLVDFSSKIRSNLGPMFFEGEPQHSGVSFRAHEEVGRGTWKETYFLRPDGKGEPGSERTWNIFRQADPINEVTSNMPWNAMSFVVGGKRYTVARIDHPANPKGSRSGERVYGRFGSTFDYRLKSDETLDVRYRLWIREGEMTSDEVKRIHAAFADPVSVDVTQPVAVAQQPDKSADDPDPAEAGDADEKKSDAASS